MILWGVLIAMAAGATASVLMPLMIRHRPPRSRADHDLEIYRDQRAEVERDHARGLIADREVEAARTEIGRRLLAAEDARIDPHGPSRTASRAGLAVVLGVFVPVAALGLYAWQGSPGLSGQPAAERPAVAAASETGDMAALVARLAERLSERPDDAKGWQLLGRSLSTLERFGEAAQAYARAAALLPKDADIRSLHGEALMAASQGQVTPAARLAFAEALSRNAKQPRARFYLGLAALQAGDRAGSLAQWRALAADSKPEDEWMPMLRQRIAGLAGEARDQKKASGDALDGNKESVEASAETGGPSREDVAAARQMSPEDRQAMIRTMVDRLAARLAEAPDDAEGWARLARSYRVLGEPAKAREALAHLARLQPDDVGVLTAYAQSLIRTADGAPPPARFGTVIGRILEIDPDNRAALWIAGLVAEQMGSKDEAGRYWRRLKPLLPEGSSERADLDRRLDALGKPR